MTRKEEKYSKNISLLDGKIKFNLTDDLNINTDSIKLNDIEFSSNYTFKEVIIFEDKKINKLNNKEIKDILNQNKKDIKEIFLEKYKKYNDIDFDITLYLFPIIKYGKYFKNIKALPEDNYIFLILGKYISNNDELLFFISNDISKYFFLLKNKVNNKIKINSKNIVYKYVNNQELNKLVGSVFLFEKKNSTFEFIKVEEYFYDFIYYLISNINFPNIENSFFENTLNTINIDRINREYINSVIANYGKIYEKIKNSILYNEKVLKGLDIEHFIIKEGFYKESAHGTLKNPQKIKQSFGRYWGGLVNNLELSLNYIEKIHYKNKDFNFKLSSLDNSVFFPKSSLSDEINKIINFYKYVKIVRDTIKTKNNLVPLFLIDKSFEIERNRNLTLKDIINKTEILYFFPEYSIVEDNEIYYLEKQDVDIENYNDRDCTNYNIDCIAVKINYFKQHYKYISLDNIDKFKKLDINNFIVLFKNNNKIFLAKVLKTKQNKAEEYSNKVKVYSFDYSLRGKIDDLCKLKIIFPENQKCKGKKEYCTKAISENNYKIEIIDKTNYHYKDMKYYFSGKSNTNKKDKTEDKLSKNIVKMFNNDNKLEVIPTGQRELADIIGYKIKNNILYLHLIHTKLDPFLNKTGKEDSAYSKYEGVEAQVVNRLSMFVGFNKVKDIIEKINSFFNEKLLDLDEEKLSNIKKVNIVISFFINKKSLKQDENKKYYISNSETFNFISEIIFGKLNQISTLANISFKPIIVEVAEKNNKST